MLEELSLHILDIGMNSIAAGAKTLEIAVIENEKRDWLIIRVRDDGHGMDAETLHAVLDRNLTNKKSRKKAIGLGLAFSAASTASASTLSSSRAAAMSEA